MMATIPKRKRCYTTDEMLARLRRAVEDAGTQLAFAASVDLSQPMLSQILSRERLPSDKVLDRIGLVAVNHYEEYEKYEEKGSTTQTKSLGL